MVLHVVSVCSVIGGLCCALSVTACLLWLHHSHAGLLPLRLLSGSCAVFLLLLCHVADVPSIGCILSQNCTCP